jgi:hypothetical protein
MRAGWMCHVMLHMAWVQAGAEPQGTASLTLTVFLFLSTGTAFRLIVRANSRRGLVVKLSVLRACTVLLLCSTLSSPYRLSTAGGRPCHSLCNSVPYLLPVGYPRRLPDHEQQQPLTSRLL